MTEIKKIEGFTPGPWMVEQCEHHLWVGPGKNDNTKVDEIVLGMDYGPEYRATHNGKQLANASLIAYAPELYAIALEQQAEIERLKGLLEDQFDRRHKEQCVKVADISKAWKQYCEENQL